MPKTASLVLAGLYVLHQDFWFSTDATLVLDRPPIAPLTIGSAALIVAASQLTPRAPLRGHAGEMLPRLTAY